MRLLLTFALAGIALVAHPLIDAAKRSDKDAIRSLLQKKTDVNITEGDGATALHWAAYRGDVDMTQALLKAGASVKAVTRIGSMSPLFMAAKGGNGAVIEALPKAGGNALEAATARASGIVGFRIKPTW